jgi:hypothetical protein
MVLAEPKVVILDEATSALDAATEYNLHQALARFLSGRTTLIIAHRLSAVKQADRVLVFDGGHIAEDGDHQQLIAEGGCTPSCTDTLQSSLNQPRLCYRERIFACVSAVHARDFMKQSGLGTPRLLGIVWPFIAVVLFQALLGCVSLYVLSACAAMWRRKPVVQGPERRHLLPDLYADSRDEATYLKYQQAIAVPQGGHELRVALDRPP